MDNTKAIENIFQGKSIEILGSVIWDNESTSHLVFIPTKMDGRHQQSPSNFLIHQAEKEVEGLFGKITIILIRKDNEDVASSVKSMIMRRYSEDIRNVFSRVEKSGVFVWVEPKVATNKGKSDEIRKDVSGLVEYFGLRLQGFTNTRELNLPTETACINIIRRMAPVSSGKLVGELERRGYQIPGDDWIAKILDRWRKRRLIHRKADGNFIMTLQGLSALGSRRTRHSPDISRALDMARREN